MYHWHLLLEMKYSLEGLLSLSQMMTLTNILV